MRQHNRPVIRQFRHIALDHLPHASCRRYNARRVAHGKNAQPAPQHRNHALRRTAAAQMVVAVIQWIALKINLGNCAARRTEVEQRDQQVRLALCKQLAKRYLVPPNSANGAEPW